MPKFPFGDDPMRGDFEPKLVKPRCQSSWRPAVPLSSGLIKLDNNPGFVRGLVFLQKHMCKKATTRKLQHVVDEQKLGLRSRGKPTHPRPAAFGNHPRQVGRLVGWLLGCLLGWCVASTC